MTQNRVMFRFIGPYKQLDWRQVATRENNKCKRENVRPSFTATAQTKSTKENSHDDLYYSDTTETVRSCINVHVANALSASACLRQGLLLVGSVVAPLVDFCTMYVCMSLTHKNACSIRRFTESTWYQYVSYTLYRCACTIYT